MKRLTAYLVLGFLAFIRWLVTRRVSEYFSIKRTTSTAAKGPRIVISLQDRRINSQGDLRIAETSSSTIYTCTFSVSESFIGGGDSNVIDSSDDSAILCGDSNEIKNKGGSRTDESAIIAGEKNEIIGGFRSMIGAGSRNQITSERRPNGAGVFVGQDNKAQNDFAVVLGGERNSAKGRASFLGCGYDNVAAGDGSAVSGAGKGNSALGDFSHVMGSFGKAEHRGSIVISAKESDASPCRSMGVNTLHLCSETANGIYLNGKNIYSDIGKLDQRVLELEGQSRSPTPSPTRNFVCGFVEKELRDGRLCKPFESCDVNEDCINGRCVDGVCDPSSANAVMATFATLLSVTFAVFLCCCSYCCIQRADIARRRRERFERNVRKEEFRMFTQLAPGVNHVKSRKAACLQTILECMEKSRKSMSECGRIDRNPRLQRKICDMCRRFRILVCICMQCLHLHAEDKDNGELDLADLYRRIRNELEDLSKSVELNLEVTDKVDEVITRIEKLMTDGFKRLADILSERFCFDSGSKKVCLMRPQGDSLTEDGAVQGQGMQSIVNIVTDKTENWVFAEGETESSPNDAFQRLEVIATSLMPKFISGNGQSRDERSFWNKHFPRWSRYPWFYGILSILVLSIFISFLAKINTSNEQFADGSSADRDDFEGRPGGFGKPFFGVPPQYDFAQSGAQNVAIPIVYGIMHNVLFMLGLLPLPFCRGLIRDLSRAFPSLRTVVPLNDLEYVHRMCGFAALFGIFLAATIWLSVMGTDCFARKISSACEAFEPVVEVFANPIENVVMLRFIIWILWFTLMPLLYFAKVLEPPKFVLRLPLLGMRWYEFCYYTHVIVAAITLLLALIGRFFIFYPVLISWGLYAIDLVRERLTHCYGAEVDLAASRVVLDQRGRPVVVKLQLNPNNGCLRLLNVSAGQWIYLKFPGVHTFHPFSVTSKSTSKDMPITLLVGVKTNNQQFTFSGTPKTPSLPVGKRTWTYQVMDTVRSAPRQSVVMLGPYGDAFQSCFDSEYASAIVIGAGTGLASVMSVLRETIVRRQCQKPVPSRLHLVWCCRNVENLMWCWNDILELLYEASSNNSHKAIDPQLLHIQASSFDWLSITFFVSQVSETRGVAAKNVVSRELPLVGRLAEYEAASEIRKWMLNQVVEGSIDELRNNDDGYKESYVYRLIRGCEAKAIQEMGGLKGDPKVTVCYTGPPALAFLIHSTTSKIGVHVEFSSDHQ